MSKSDLTVYCTRKLFDPAMKILESVAEVRFWDKETPPPRDVLLREVRDVDGLCCLLTEKIDREVMDAGQKLKVISQVAVGYDNIDVEAATERGIYVTNTPGVLTETTADFAWALLMSVARRVVEADKYVRSGKWVIPWSLTMLLGGDVYGKTLGIVGLGRIGSAVARRAKGFNMKVIYYDVFRNLEAEKTLGIEFREFKDLLKEADFISIHVPLTKNTYHLFGEEEFKAMKPTAYLINTSRGPVIDEKALYKALKEGWIKGAGLDVHEKEPTPPDNPLLTLDNIVVAPHIASGSVETRTKMTVIAAENLVAVLKGKVPPNLVNKEVLKVRPLEP